MVQKGREWLRVGRRASEFRRRMKKQTKTGHRKESPKEPRMFGGRLAGGRRV